MSFGVLVLLVVVGTTIWVGVDSSRRDWGDRGSGTAGWVVGCLLLWIVVFPVYLSKRNKAPLKDAPAFSAGPAALPHGGMHRECPHCKEPMRRDADTCPHCRQPSTAWRFHEGRWWYRASDDDVWQWLNEPTGEWVSIDAAAVPG